MRSINSKAGVLGLGAVLAFVLSMSSAGALEARDIPSPKSVASTTSTSSTPVSRSHMPLCAWRHCQNTSSTPESQSHMPLCAWRHCQITS